MRGGAGVMESWVWRQVVCERRGFEGGCEERGTKGWQLWEIPRVMGIVEEREWLVVSDSGGKKRLWEARQWLVVEGCASRDGGEGVNGGIKVWIRHGCGVVVMESYGKGWCSTVLEWLSALCYFL
ncbi:hypothetical protein [Bartonella tribocorum]|uniref:Uncharacterized protein n=1 Tax=Bartonella tribocorum TaxID=85701 RepID=A0A2M6USK5_9HYPH|nr:hypothetical protein [Bartonella tribocorum]PIT69165.1 hypothetical protein CEV08_06725 [Bartonella tribocorum]